MVRAPFHVGRLGVLVVRHRRTPEGIEAFVVRFLRANGIQPGCEHGCPQTRHLLSNRPEMRRF